MASKPSIGGQAVIEGVMMRGPASWAVAVRTPDGAITAETHMLPGHAQRYPFLRWPFVRGVYVLVESLSIGIRALRISTAHALGEEERPSDKQLGWTMALAVLFFTGLFVALPALAVKFGGRLLEQESQLVQNLAEGALRIGLFVGYILLISLLPDIRRVFQYHGAEHKTIYAYENDDPLEPEVIDRYSTLHVRCGTNFLFIVLFLTLAAHLVLDLLLPPSIPLRVAARVLAIPFLAGLAYEVIKAASRQENSLPFRILSLPGLALQKITTRPPSRDQIEVAVKAMESVIGREQLASSREPAQQVGAPIPPLAAPGAGTAPTGPA
ncbi:MAG: DUF1385 domain-containing protein [Actinomycetota bacterium]